ncbi:MAG TPA: FAD-binding oxidoreductase [Spirochaetia bacterium]|nr:FAD-binding oxidoreductase [Spirochaetia bacterium]
MSVHSEKIDRVRQQLRERRGSKRIVAFSKSSVSHTAPDARDPRYQRPKIDLTLLNEVLEIDGPGKNCTAESGVTFSELIRSTLRQGLIPMTVPELKTITIGGAVTGCSVESMSYKYGGFHDSCLEYEVITGTGEVVVCSERQDSDIFHMIHGSFGTLGILTKLKFRLIPIKPFVRMNYVTFANVRKYWDFLYERCQSGDHDFLDGIIHGRNTMVVCLGTAVDSAPYLSSYQGNGIYYRSTLEREEDFLPTYDYLFRYDTECHWLTSTIPFMEAPIARLLLGRFFLGSSNLIRLTRIFRHFLKLKRRPEVVVDVFLPSSKSEEFYNWYEREVAYYPLWIVPYRMKEIYPWIADRHRRNIGGERLFIDFAVYGKKNNDPRIDYSELLERKVFESNGVKTLISRNHYTPDTFWKIYDRPRYERIKAGMDPENLFGDLYAKLHPHREPR